MKTINIQVTEQQYKHLKTHYDFLSKIFGSEKDNDDTTTPGETLVGEITEAPEVKSDLVITSTKETNTPPAEDQSSAQIVIDTDDPGKAEVVKVEAEVSKSVQDEAKIKLGYEIDPDNTRAILSDLLGTFESKDLFVLFEKVGAKQPSVTSLSKDELVYLHCYAGILQLILANEGMQTDLSLKGYTRATEILQDEIISVYAEFFKKYSKGVTE